jgi:hypothetical protein
MSIKNFLETKEMQTGGMLSFNSLDTGASFVSPFAKPESPRSKFPSPVERAPLPIPKKETPPTIKLEDPIDMDPGSFDPSNSGTLSIHHPSVIAGAEALNYTLTGAESQETLMDIVANAPGNKFTDFLDAAGLFVGKGLLTAATGGAAAMIPLALVNKATTGSVTGLAKGELFDLGKEAAKEVAGNIGQALGIGASEQAGLGAVGPSVGAAPAGVVPTEATIPEGAVQAFAGINQSLAAPAGAAFGIEDFAPEVPVAPAAPAPIASGYATQVGPSSAEVERGMAIGQARVAAEQGRLANQNARGLLAMEKAQAQAAYEATVPTAAAVGTGMFGVAYGMGGEISPSFAIGGKGSFTSFAHYSAGISQADEISMGQAGIASGAYESAADAQSSISAMISGGHSEATISAAATTGTTTQDIEGLATATGAGDAGVGDPSKVICQELYDQGLLEHSIYSLDEQFGEQLRKHDTDLLEGYHTWAYDVVDAMRKSKTITHIVRIVSRPVVKHIAYKMGYPSKTLLGAAMFNVGAFVCRRLAKKETVYA